MKLHIFIVDENGDRVLIDRVFRVVEGRAPNVDLQAAVDDAIYYKQRFDEEEVRIEAKRLEQQDKQE